MSSVTYQCNVCNKQFTTFRKLARHRKTHEGIRFLCKLCDSTYTRKDYYQVHYRKKHAGNQLGIEDAFAKIDSTRPPEQATTRRSQSNATDREGSDEKENKTEQEDASHISLGSDERNEISEEDVVELERKIGKYNQCQNQLGFIENENYSQKKHTCVICEETFSTATCLDCHMKTHISEKSVSNGQICAFMQSIRIVVHYVKESLLKKIN
ncbi:uncharacterized protein LOC143448942 [Clavelina lepadiformis]|uniref:uncharacterized protein LOC143448942 n=1 Tax=Clavelina lepadiformis TaxID=159417 RepID=UPI0040435C79